MLRQITYFDRYLGQHKARLDLSPGPPQAVVCDTDKPRLGTNYLTLVALIAAAWSLSKFTDESWAKCSEENGDRSGKAFAAGDGDARESRLLTPNDTGRPENPPRGGNGLSDREPPMIDAPSRPSERSTGSGTPSLAASTCRREPDCLDRSVNGLLRS